MARLYIDGDEVRFTKRDRYSVNLEFYDGRKFEDLEPRRLFPVSGLTRYIMLLDETGKEQAIIRDMDTLMPESKVIIEACLRELLIGTEDDKIGQIKETLKKYCSTRKQVAQSSNSLGKGLKHDGLGDEVVVGGATFFVLSVEEFDKI